MRGESPYPDENRELTNEERRGWELFISLLMPAQLEELRQFSYVSVTGSAGRPWRLWCRGRAGWMGGVQHSVNSELLDEDGNFQALFCGVIDEHVGSHPQSDNLVAQLLAIMSDEHAYVRASILQAGSIDGPGSRRPAASSRPWLTPAPFAHPELLPEVVAQP
jgi:hypothetical protein